jgi:hypothetical protein
MECGGNDAALAFAEKLRSVVWPPNSNSFPRVFTARVSAKRQKGEIAAQDEECEDQARGIRRPVAERIGDSA